MELPTSDEINVHGSLDERWAVKNFLGKSLCDAEALFRENDLHHLDDLNWMGPKAFCYYVAAAISYLKSESAKGGPDAVNFFHGILENRLLHQRADIVPVIPILHEAVRYILDHWDKFDIDPEIYGSLNNKYKHILNQLVG
jgi:hypothetical protein